MERGWRHLLWEIIFCQLVYHFGSFLIRAAMGVYNTENTLSVCDEEL